MRHEVVEAGPVVGRGEGVGVPRVGEEEEGELDGEYGSPHADVLQEGPGVKLEGEAQARASARTEEEWSACCVRATDGRDGSCLCAPGAWRSSCGAFDSCETRGALRLKIERSVRGGM